MHITGAYGTFLKNMLVHANYLILCLNSRQQALQFVSQISTLKRNAHTPYSLLGDIVFEGLCIYVHICM